MKKEVWIGWLLGALLLVSCEKDKVDYGLGNFRVDLATCRITEGSPVFVLDNGVQLASLQKLSLVSQNEGNRFLVNYAYTDDEVTGVCRNAVINSFSRIISDTVQYRSRQELGALANDPIEFVSAWYSGGCANFRFKLEVNQRVHRINLFAREKKEGGETDVLHLELRHDRNGDTPGYYTSEYGSFYLDHLLTDEITTVVVHIRSSNYGDVPFTFRVNQNIETIYGYQE